MKPPVFTLAVFASALLATSLSTPLHAADEADPGAWRGQSITEFDSDEKSMGWQIVNDGVMGGLSKGAMSVAKDGILTFSGTLSLENNGGFSLVESKALDLNLSNDLGILLLVKGDGRKYQFRVESDATYRGMPVSFSGTFSTEKGKWQQVKVPFSEFKGGWRGRDLPDETLNPAAIGRVGILLGDKKSGPFELQIDWIRTYGKGQGEFTARKPVTKETKATGPQPLIATAVADGRFNTLKAALDAAGLTTFFQWDNKLTVFAPTDEAFAKLPEGVLEDLLKPENKQRLVSILSLHVHPGSLDLASALGDAKVKTVEGTPLNVAFSEGRIRVNEATLLDADIECADGTIHVIDRVLLPAPKRQTVLTTAAGAGAFSTLLAAVKAAGLDSALEGEAPLTVFAPTDEAFAALPEGTVESLLKKENRQQLKDLLTAHVVAGNVTAGDALNAGSAKTLSGTPLKFAINDGLFTVNGSVIRTAGIDGGNGTIHVISSVIGFPETATCGKSDCCKAGCEIKTAACESDCAMDQATATKSCDECPTDSSADSPNAVALITEAISKGVPLYNQGAIQACADIYEGCILSLSQMDNIDTQIRQMLDNVVHAGRQQDFDRRAWFYRHALDRMMQLLPASS